MLKAQIPQGQCPAKLANLHLGCIPVVLNQSPRHPIKSHRTAYEAPDLVGYGLGLVLAELLTAATTSASKTISVMLYGGPKSVTWQPSPNMVGSHIYMVFS